jgi:hypothetical protein
MLEMIDRKSHKMPIIRAGQFAGGGFLRRLRLHCG